MQEVKHWAPGGAKVVTLEVDALGEHSLHHLVSGEKVVLPKGDWQLRFRNDWAFVVCPGHAPVWCNKLFKTSVWSTRTGGIFLQEKVKQSDGSESLRKVWLHEKEARREPFWAHWQYPDLVRNMDSLQGVTVEPTRGGSRVFWAIQDIQQAAAFETPWARASRWVAVSMKSWQRFLADLHLWDLQVMSPYGSGSGGEGYHVWLLSTAALLAIWVRTAQALRDSSDKQRMFALLVGYLRAVLPDFDMHLTPGARGSPGKLEAAGGFHVACKGGCMYWESVSRAWPVCQVGSTVAHMLLHLFGMRSETPWAFQQVVCCLAAAIEDHHRHLQWSKDPLQSLQPCGKRRKINPAVRVAVAALDGGPARNSYRAARTAQLLGLSVPRHENWMDKLCNRRYFMACCRSVANGTSFAVTLDKSRCGAGREWLKSCLLNIDTGEAMWCAPQARHRPVCSCAGCTTTLSQSPQEQEADSQAAHGRALR